MVLSFRNHAVHANVAVEDNAESISPELNQMVLDLLLVDLRHADDPDEDGHTDAVAMRKILTTMKVTGMDNLRNVLNVHQIQSPAFINSVQPALDWLTVLAKWQLLDIEETPEDFDEMKHEVAARYTHVAHNWPTPAALTHWGPGNKSVQRIFTTPVQQLRQFSGDHGDWLEWSQQSVGHFATSNLIKVIKSRNYALKNPDENGLVWGMLVASISTTAVARLALTTKEEHDGHEAWHKLRGYYEGEELVIHWIKKYNKVLDNLRLTEGGSLREFHNSFTDCMCKLTQYMKIVTEKKLKADEIPDSYNWWKLYTAKLTDPKYNTKDVKESLERYKEDGYLDGIYHLLLGMVGPDADDEIYRGRKIPPKPKHETHHEVPKNSKEMGNAGKEKGGQTEDTLKAFKTRMFNHLQGDEESLKIFRELLEKDKTTLGKKGGGNGSYKGNKRKKVEKTDARRVRAKKIKSSMRKAEKTNSDDDSNHSMAQAADRLG